MRLAIFADIHGNLPALQAVLADMKRCGDFDMIWCLGDLAALGGLPHECIQTCIMDAARAARARHKFKDHRRQY